MRQLRKVLPRWRVPTASETAAHCRSFLSLYGGKGKAARSLSSRGWATAEVDACISAMNNLDSEEARRDVDDLAAEVSLLGIELDCATFSLARRGKSGSSTPQRLRDRRRPWGLPGLVGSNLQKLRSANARVRHAIRLILRSIWRKQSGYLENPLGLILWHIVRKEFHSVLASGYARLVDTDLCCFGTPWRKPTKVLIWGAHVHEVVLPRCHPCNKLCSTSGKPHYQLSSTVSCKELVHNCVFKTRQAQVYPAKFESRLLDQLAPR